MDILTNFFNGFYVNEIKEYPKEIKINFNTETFEKFLLWNKNYTKEDIIIFCIYHNHYNCKPFDVELKGILKVYNILSKDELINLIYNLINLFHTGKKIIFYEDIEIYINLFSKKITVEDVLTKYDNKDSIKKYLFEYIKLLNKNITFETIYIELLEEFLNNENKDTRKKLSALYCAEYIYEKNIDENVIVKKINYKK